MFRLFKKKTELDLLCEEYEKLIKEARRLSSSNRLASDLKYADAEQVACKIDALKIRQGNLL